MTTTTTRRHMLLLVAWKLGPSGEANRHNIYGHTMRDTGPLHHPHLWRRPSASIGGTSRTRRPRKMTCCMSHRACVLGPRSRCDASHDRRAERVTGPQPAPRRKTSARLSRPFAAPSGRWKTPGENSRMQRCERARVGEWHGPRLAASGNPFPFRTPALAAVANAARSASPRPLPRSLDNLRSSRIAVVLCDRAEGNTVSDRRCRDSNCAINL